MMNLFIQFSPATCPSCGTVVLLIGWARRAARNVKAIEVFRIVGIIYMTASML
jgi:hypothetical protein